MENLIKEANEDIVKSSNLDDLNNIKIKYLGKNSKIKQIMFNLKTLSVDKKKLLGKKINYIHKQINMLINDKYKYLQSIHSNNSLLNKYIDITLDGDGYDIGKLHPITKTINFIENFFINIGFNIVEGPEIENNYYNFEALNISKYHPARTMHDTFYIDEDHLLRTHTSGIQIRTIENNNLPIKSISIGKVYRKDHDISHTPMFHQVEGFCIDKNISFITLKNIMISFLKEFFCKNLKVRFRPSYFPFTEPSAELDIECFFCNKNGCAICKYSNWLEILGCGMIHPNILKISKQNIKKYKGLAFGIGVERLCMLKYQINDIRLLFENNLHFLKQFII